MTRPRDSGRTIVRPRQQFPNGASNFQLVDLCDVRKWRPPRPRTHAFGVLIVARFLVLKIHSELDYAGAEILDGLTISGKWNGACAEKRIDRGSVCMVEEVKELCD
jgi:hypothetical protein